MALADKSDYFAYHCNDCDGHCEADEIREYVEFIEKDLKAQYERADKYYRRIQGIKKDLDGIIARSPLTTAHYVGERLKLWFA